MGKAEGTGKNWHGHVTAITVGPEYRRLGLADGMMDLLEEVSEKTQVLAACVALRMTM
jgi:N-terminal acetyltransferase B complex catalytic subunit